MSYNQFSCLVCVLLIHGNRVLDAVAVTRPKHLLFGVWISPVQLLPSSKGGQLTIITGYCMY